MGVLIITAPQVPPKTMMAAVICEMSRMLPPSIIRPPTIPPKARIRPQMWLSPDGYGAEVRERGASFVRAFDGLA